MFTFSNTFRNQRGLTLIELLISIVIASFLLIILVQIYFETKNAQVLQAAITDVEFNASRTISILSSELKRAGHIGCAHLSQDFPLNSNNFISANNIIVGKDNEIQIRYVDLPGVILKQISAGTLVASHEKEFKENDILMISDCHKAEVFTVKAVQATDSLQNITPNEPLKNVYDENAEIGRVVNNRYYLDNTDAGHSLFVEDIEHKKIVLVDHVDEISFLYTIPFGSQFTDVKATTVADWTRVVGVAADIKVSAASSELEKIWHMYVAISTS